MFEHRYDLKIKIVNPDVYEYYKKVVHNYSNKYKNHPDSGFDLISPYNSIETHKDNDTALIDLGIQCSLTKTISLANGNVLKEPSPFYLYTRSSIYKTCYRLSNNVGIIDSGYRGNLIGAFRNLSGEPYVINKHSRLLQVCAPDLRPMVVKLVDESFFEETSRQEGGFGSTGV